MAQSNVTELHSIGVNDDTWKTVSSDEARALLCIFSAPESESHALGTALLHTPNGKDLYVAPRLVSRY